MKKLLIVESPGKIATLRKLLGKDFTVKASLGHVRDLPPDELGVDLEDGFAETYAVLPERRRALAAIKRAAREATVIFLATDPDREGEAIAWHVAECLPRRDRQKLARIAFNQLTAEAVREAIAHPRQLDHKLVDAQRVRRVTDRLIGYQISPLLRGWGLEAPAGLSAGRTQTAALRLVVEREWERRDFTPRPYWVLQAEFEHDGGAFVATLDGEPDISSGEEVCLTLDQLKLPGTAWQVEAIERLEKRQTPPPPFTTSALQQSAARQLGFTPGRTQQAAQALYEQGLVTYIRSDGLHVAPEAQAAAREVIANLFGADYLPPEPPEYRARRDSQGAHEAIRPSDPARLPDDLTGEALDSDARQLYGLIWRRFVASQMAPAWREVTTVSVRPCWMGRVEPWEEDESHPHPYLFTARTRKLVFDGFTLAYQPEDAEPDCSSADSADLDGLVEGNLLKLRELGATGRKTSPPQRFTQATLVGEMERLGIGRPSTYVATVETLLARQYAREEQAHLLPTPLGEDVLHVCLFHFPQVFDLGFTATLEQLLDRVASGTAARRSVLSVFYGGGLKPALDAARAALAAESGQPVTPPQQHSQLEKEPA